MPCGCFYSIDCFLVFRQQHWRRLRQAPGRLVRDDRCFPVSCRRLPTLLSGVKERRVHFRLICLYSSNNHHNYRRLASHIIVRYSSISAAPRWFCISTAARFQWDRYPETPVLWLSVFIYISTSLQHHDNNVHNENCVLHAEHLILDMTSNIV